MRKEQISDALNLLDDAILEEADRIRNREEKAVSRESGQEERAASPQNRRVSRGDNVDSTKIWERRRWKWAAAVAGLLLAAWVGWIIMEQRQLPMLSVAEIGQGEAAGYEGVRVHDISELVNANPWNEELGISALPVYENVLSYDEGTIVQGGDFDKMREFLL